MKIKCITCSVWGKLAKIHIEWLSNCKYVIKAAVKSIVILAGNVKGFFFFKYRKNGVLTSFDGNIIEPSKFTE